MLAQTMFYIFLIGLILFFCGRHFRDYTSGIIGGFIILSTGFAMLISPVTNISSFLNVALGTGMLGFGGYVFIAGSLEVMKKE